MRCPACHNTNLAHAAECEFCGHALSPAAATPRATVFERGSGAPDPVKRRTVYEPPRAPAVAEAPPVDPFAAAVRRAPVDPADPFRGPARPTITPESLGDPSPTPRRPTLHGAAVAGAARPTPARPVGVLLVMLRPDDPGVAHILREGRTTIGREEGHDVRLDDAHVSGLHGFVFASPGGARFIDVSTNGSRVDGAVCHGAQVDLRAGSVLALGGARLVFSPLAPVPADLWAST